MKTVIVIPARYGSTRFPGKPLFVIKGKSMLSRTWAIAKAVQRVDDVIIATDDQRIFDHAEAFGARVCMTSENCPNGTERVFEVVEKETEKPDVIINLQGDALLTPPDVIQSLVDVMLSLPELSVATPAVQLDWKQFRKISEAKKAGHSSGTLVTFDKEMNALYFSKSLIPFHREREGELPSVFRHIGIYAYRYSLLKTYLSLEPTLFERIEKLEQLRLLENGYKVKIVLVDYHGKTHWSVDAPEDAEVAAEIIEKEGELVSGDLL